MLKLRSFSLYLETAKRIEAGFFKIIGLNELRIHLADITHIAITVSEIYFFNLHQLSLLRITIFLTLCRCFHRCNIQLLSKQKIIQKNID